MKGFKKFACISFAAVLLISFGSCGNNDKNSNEKENESSQNGVYYDISPSSVLAEMTEGLSLPEMTEFSSHDENGNETDGWKDIFSVSLYEDFDTELVEAFALTCSDEATADEITVVKLKNASDADKLKAEMEKHVHSRVSVFKGYGPGEVSKLEACEIVIKGNVAALIVCDDAQKASEAFDAAVK